MRGARFKRERDARQLDVNRGARAAAGVIYSADGFGQRSSRLLMIRDCGMPIISAINPFIIGWRPAALPPGDTLNLRKSIGHAGGAKFIIDDRL